jgi:exosortase
MVGQGMTSLKSTRLLLAGLLGSFALLYWNIWAGLIRDWSNDDNYSHGFLIVPLAAYLAWERRNLLLTTPIRGSLVGVVVVIGSIFVLLAGLLGAELFLTRFSIIGCLAGGVLFVLGWAHLRVLAFPIALLLLMIPIPAIVFNQIAFPLQLLASQVGEVTLNALNIPVLREGNVMILAHTTLEVAEACSGIRSLISLLTLGIVYGYFTDPRGWVRFVVAASTVPIAVFANAARVAGTGVAAHYYGPAAAEGFFHEFSGWMVFVFAFLLLFGVYQVIRRMAPPAEAPAGLNTSIQAA